MTLPSSSIARPTGTRARSPSCTTRWRPWCSAWSSECSVTAPRPRRSPRRSSSTCGATAGATTTSAAACGRGRRRSPTAAPSTACAPSRRTATVRHAMRSTPRRPPTVRRTWPSTENRATGRPRRCRCWPTCSARRWNWRTTEGSPTSRWRRDRVWRWAQPRHAFATAWHACELYWERRRERASPWAGAPVTDDDEVLVALAAVGALDDDERAEFEARLAGEPELAAAYDEALESAGLLAEAVREP